MKIVLITRDRPELTRQTIETMKANAIDWSRHELVVVFDGTEDECYDFYPTIKGTAELWIMATGKPIGVGGAKNYGTTYFNAEYDLPEDTILMFSDNDMYYLPGWDKRLEESLLQHEVQQLGGWKHPYHKLGSYIVIPSPFGDKDTINTVDAVTGNCFVIRWADWLKYGPFDANALGPGQSEDYALSQKIKAGGGVVATLDPPVAIHCGLANCLGEPATGWQEMSKMAEAQIEKHHIDKIWLATPDEGTILLERQSTLTAKDKEQSKDTKRVLALGRSENQQWVRDNSSSTLINETSSQSKSLGLYGLPIKQSLGSDAQMRCETLCESGASNSRYAQGQHKRYVGEGQTTENPQFPEEADIQGYNNSSDAVSNREIHKQEPCKRMGIGEVYCSSYCFWQDLGFRTSLINCGSGQRRFDNKYGWLNLDCVSRPPDQVPDVVCDATKLVEQFGANTQDMVVLHHVLEHFGCGEADDVIRQCYEVLKPGGSLLVFVPDMLKLAGRWLGGEISDFIFFVNAYGAYQGEDGDRHKWGYSTKGLTNYLYDVLSSAVTENEAVPFIGQFDWRPILGADIAKDWWILGVEVVK